MALIRPTASITLNGEKLSSAEAGLANLRLDLGLNSHDRAQLQLWPRSKFSGAAAGMELTIGLHTTADTGGGLLGAATDLLGGGEDDSLVFTGTVESVQSSVGVLIINGLANSANLSQQRRSETWSGQSATDIVKDLAGDLDSDIEAELDLANYCVDNGRSVWGHLRELAKLAGAELSSAADGGVRFILASKETSSTELRYGAELLDWQLTRSQAPTAVGAAEFGAASSEGNDKWHWIAHDPVGSGGEAARLPAAFRTRDAAQRFSEAVQARATRAAVRGSVWIGGKPELRPGALVELTGLPEGDSGPLRVRSVTHQLDGDSGFITALAVEAAGGSGGLGAGLGGLL